MIYIEAPQPLSNIPRPAVFLAGGITGCHDWQCSVSMALVDVEGVRGSILNPRRANFPMGDPEAGREQIMWEYRALWEADVIAFWFASGMSDQPIAMFELGVHLTRYSLGMGPKRLIVGCDPSYKRKFDVYAQLEANNRSIEGSLKTVVTSETIKDHATNILHVMKGL